MNKESSSCACQKKTRYGEMHRSSRVLHTHILGKIKNNLKKFKIIEPFLKSKMNTDTVIIKIFP
jgi:hypothetical protein